MNEIIRFEPIYQDRVWGGRRLEQALGRSLERDRVIGESWEIVDRPEAQSIIRGGRWDGLSLRAAIERDSAAVMGPRWQAEQPFPILVKWLDCRERLSLQVHPPASVAPALQGEPKTENWYIADADPGAALLVGLREGVTRGQFEAALNAGTAEECVRRLPVSRGDSILVQSGTVHAIDAGNLILEIQQNSDTTYRVYDWGRTGLDGKPRRLHVAESLESILWDAPEPALIRAPAESALLAECREFRIRQILLAPGARVSFAAGQPRIVSVVEGWVEARLDPRGRVDRGENVLIPAAAAIDLCSPEGAKLLLTENFT